MKDFTAYIPNNRIWYAKRRPHLIYWILFFMLFGVLVGFWLSGLLDSGTYQSIKGDGKNDLLLNKDRNPAGSAVSRYQSVT